MNNRSRIQKKYDDKYMVTYSIKYNKKIYQFVEKAIADLGISKNRFSVDAIIEKLKRDGYWDENIYNQDWWITKNSCKEKSCITIL